MNKLGQENTPTVTGRVVNETNDTKGTDIIAKFVVIENAEWSENMKCVPEFLTINLEDITLTTL